MQFRTWKAVLALAAVAVTTTRANAQLTTVNFFGGNSGGYTDGTVTGNSNPWTYNAATGWSVNGIANPSVERLMSPVLTATGTSWGFSFASRFNFEASSTPGIAFDGGLVAVSINGGAFNSLGSIGSPYNYTISSSFGNPYAGFAVFSGTSVGYSNPDFLTTTFSGTATAGTTFRFAFDGAWDNSVSVSNPNWQLQSVEYRDLSTSTTTTPEPSTYLLMSAGLLIVGGAARRRKSSKR